MKVNCVWEHNGADTLLYAVDYIGAYTRGSSPEEAMSKMENEILSYLNWCSKNRTNEVEVVIIDEKESELNIKDADSDVIFDKEKEHLTIEEYNTLKALTLKSGEDFIVLYESIPDKNMSTNPERQTFYGKVPRTASEMYEHTKSVNSYYFKELNVNVTNDGNIYECRKRGFEELEKQTNFLSNTVFMGSYGEEWSLRKMIRRFIWHDRIHAKAMYRMATKVFGAEKIKNPFCFELYNGK